MGVTLSQLPLSNASGAIDVSDNVDASEDTEGGGGGSSKPLPPDPWEAFKRLCVRDRFDPIFVLGSLAYL